MFRLLAKAPFFAELTTSVFCCCPALSLVAPTLFRPLRDSLSKALTPDVGAAQDSPSPSRCAVAECVDGATSSYCMSLKVSPSVTAGCPESPALTAGRLERNSSGIDRFGCFCCPDGGSPILVNSSLRSEFVRRRWRFAVTAVTWLRVLRTLGSSLTSLFSPVVVTILRHHKAYVDLRCRHRSEAAKARAARSNPSLFLGRFTASRGIGVPSEKDLLKDLRRMEEEELLYLPTELIILWCRQAVLDPGLPAYDLFLLHRHASAEMSPAAAEPAVEALATWGPARRERTGMGPAEVNQRGPLGLGLRSVLHSALDADSTRWHSLNNPSLPPLSLPPFTLTASLLPRRVYRMVQNLFPGTGRAAQGASPLSLGRQMRQHFSLGRFRQGAGRAHLSRQYGRRVLTAPSPWSPRYQCMGDEWIEPTGGYPGPAPQRTESFEQRCHHLSGGHSSTVSGSGYGGDAGISSLTRGDFDRGYFGKSHQWPSPPETEDIASGQYLSVGMQKGAAAWGPVSQRIYGRGPPRTSVPMPASCSRSAEPGGWDSGSSSQAPAGAQREYTEYTTGRFGRSDAQRTARTDDVLGNLSAPTGAYSRHPWEDGQQPWQQQQANLQQAAMFDNADEEQARFAALFLSRAGRDGTVRASGATPAGASEVLHDPVVRSAEQSSALEPIMSWQQGPVPKPGETARDLSGFSVTEWGVRKRPGSAVESHDTSATPVTPGGSAGLSFRVTLTAVGLRLHHFEEQNLTTRFQWRLIEDRLEAPRLLPYGDISTARSEIPAGQLRKRNPLLRGECYLSRKWTLVPLDGQGHIDSAGGVHASVVSTTGKRRQRRAVRTAFRQRPLSAWRVENGAELPESASPSSEPRGRGVPVQRVTPRGEKRQQKRACGSPGAMECRLADQGEPGQVQHFLAGLRVPGWGKAVDIMLYDVAIQWQLISARRSRQGGDLSRRPHEGNSREAPEPRFFSNRGGLPSSPGWRDVDLPGHAHEDVGMLGGPSIAGVERETLGTWTRSGERCVFWWLSVTNAYLGPAEPSWSECFWTVFTDSTPWYTSGRTETSQEHSLPG